MVLTGYARRVSAELSPALVIDEATAALGDPALLADRCLVAVDPSFAERAGEGDVLVLDGAFADGPGAEAAVIALQALGLAAAICVAVGPELEALGAIYGLPLLVAPAAARLIAEGAVVRLDLERGSVEAEGARWTCLPVHPDAIVAARRAQLLARMRRVVEDEGYAE